MDPSTVTFSGAYALLVTPFDEGGGVDWPAYEQYVVWQTNNRASGIFAVCGSSEMRHLAPPERVALAQTAVRIAGRLPVVATANLGDDPRGHREEVRRMADTGVAGIVLVPYAGLLEDQQAAGDYYESLLAASPVPVLLYEWPGAQPAHLSPALYKRLVRAGIRGIKDTTCTVEGISSKAKAAPDATIFQANTPLLDATVSCGVGGVMAITTTAFADVVADYWRAKEQSSPDAVALNVRQVIVDAIMRMGHPVVAKYMLTLRGLRFGLTCRSGGHLSGDVAAAVRTVMPLLEGGEPGTVRAI